jgi:hypothetical protein
MKKTNFRFLNESPRLLLRSRKYILTGGSRLTTPIV